VESYEEICSGDMSPRSGDMSPLSGDMSPRSGDMSPRSGDMSPCIGDMSALFMISVEQPVIAQGTFESL
jgi:hypothetical protein